MKTEYIPALHSRVKPLMHFFKVKFSTKMKRVYFYHLMQYTRILISTKFYQNQTNYKNAKLVQQCEKKLTNLKYCSVKIIGVVYDNMYFLWNF